MNYPPPPLWYLLTIVIVSALVIMAIVPFMLKRMINFQVSIGNGNLSLIKFLSQNFWFIVGAFWLFIIIGMSMAIPAMIKDLYH